MMPEFNEFIDEYGYVHIKDKVLGQGGQGIVFRTKDPDIAIKIVIDKSGKPITSKNLVEQYSKHFKRVRLLPLPEDINISVPVALLQNKAGYVMQLLSEMIPLSHFWLDGKSAVKIGPNDIPDWLLPNDQAKKEELLNNPEKLRSFKEFIHYRNTGGLRRRLHALYKCSSLLARIHGNGMVYGDISPNNIFISERLNDSSVWLIDADNIRFEITEGGSVVYTPKYGAPELVQGKDGGRPSSDCYAFAVMAFYLLSLIHPFIGRKVNDTERDWADEEEDDENIEDKAYAGLLPWVDDQDDDSNCSDRGLPRSLILTKKLVNLFGATFEKGRESPGLRPTIYHWPEALAQAADITIECPNCHMSYYYNYKDPETNKEICPYCDSPKPQVLIFESYRWNGLGKHLDSLCWKFVREISDDSGILIPRRVFDEFSMLDSDTTEVSIFVSNKDVLIKKSDSSKLDLSVAAGNQSDSEFKKLYSQIKIEYATMDVQFWIFVDSDNPRLVKCTITGVKNEA